MKLADAFQIAETKRSGSVASGHMRSTTSAPQPMTRTGENHIKWSDAEWLTILHELMRLYPELGLPAPTGVSGVRLRQMHTAMHALPIQRRRHLVHLTGVRPRLLQYCNLLIEETKRPQAARPAFGPLPPSVVYRQPDGADNGQPPPGARIFWRENEWYALAVELVYKDPAFLETLNHLMPGDLYRAQRVLPTNRRRPQTAFNATKSRAELGPAIRRVRANIDAKRAEDDGTRAAAKAEEARREEQARQAAEIAAQAATLDRLTNSPEFIAKALGAAAFGPLLEALLSRGAASLQTMLEGALVNAFSSDAVKRAMVVNLHMDQAEGSAQALKANPPNVTANVAANVVYKPKVGIVGALGQQIEAVCNAFPQLRIKGVDKNLHGQSLKEAIVSCDRVIAMTDFINHSTSAVCKKALGDRFTLVDGGVSSVRRQIEVWLASGLLQAATVAANEQPTEAKGE